MYGDIQIMDVPEPVVLDAVRQVVENSINGLLLDPPLQAYDPENRELTYEAVGMHMTGFPFETDQSGNIFTSNGLSTERSYFTDYELKENFFYTFVAHDPPDFAVTGLLTIKIINANEVPRIRLPQEPFKVEENSENIEERRIRACTNLCIIYHEGR